jgi:hypothetical protein
MKCLVCSKNFPTISSLNRHQRTSKCSNAIQCENCSMYYVSLSKHYPDCVLFLKKENQELKDKIENMTHERLDEIQEQMKELSKKMDEKKEPIINIQNNYNIKIQNLQNLNTERFQEFAEFLTIDHIKKGVYGYAEYAISYPLSDRIVCTDFSRRKLKYKTDEGEVKTDINLNTLSKDLFKSIDCRNKELIFQYAQEYIEPIKDPEEKMNAYVKFMNYISLIRDGSEGIQHELFPDFVKQICSLSNS